MNIVVALVMAPGVILEMTPGMALAIRTAKVIQEIHELRRKNILRTNFISF